jgi:aspartate aminotransferase
MISEKMLSLGKSENVIRAIAAYADARRAEIGSENVFDFSIGNPNVPTPEKVRQTLIELLRDEDSLALHSYTAAPGIMAARKAAAAQESIRAGYEIPAESIYLTSGASSSLAIVMAALTGSGERVAVLAPYFPEYRVFAENAGAELVEIPPAGEDMQPFMAAFEAAVDQGVAAVIINSPNNPSGAILSEQTLRVMSKILQVAEQEQGHSIYLISDEPYRKLVYGGQSVPFVPNFYHNTVVCYSYSKSLSLPGERLGYIMVPPCVSDSNDVFAAVCGAGRALGYINAPSLMQHMLAKCADLRPDITSYAKNRDTLYNALTGFGFDCVKPDGAFYLFIKAPKGDSADEFCEKAKRFEILLVPSDSFGVSGYARLAYCVSEETAERSLPAFEKLASAYGLK